jgi:hypothetical protein
MLRFNFAEISTQDFPASTSSRKRKSSSVFQGYCRCTPIWTGAFFPEPTILLGKPARGCAQWNEFIGFSEGANRRGLKPMPVFDVIFATIRMAPRDDKVSPIDPFDLSTFLASPKLNMVRHAGLIFQVAHDLGSSKAPASRA